MNESIDIQLVDGMVFDISVDGYNITIDATGEHGGQGKGPRPKPLMMASLGGCTAMDVVSLLRKMRVDFTDFKVKVSGTLTEEHPKKYSKMHIRYEFYGKNLKGSMDKINKAVNLSQERYCGVSATYRDVMELTHEIRLINEK